jgi:hypothetical protein
MHSHEIERLRPDDQDQAERDALADEAREDAYYRSERDRCERETERPR